MYEKQLKYKSLKTFKNQKNVRKRIIFCLISEQIYDTSKKLMNNFQQCSSIPAIYLRNQFLAKNTDQIRYFSRYRNLFFPQLELAATG